jgi:aspartate aminotransferase-like enzyme
MQISDGYGKLKGATFRIAHMGEIQLSDLETLFAAIENYLANR